MLMKQMVAGLTPEMIQRFQFAVETGKWPDGSGVTDRQRDAAMQALMFWQAEHNQDAQHLTVGKGGQMTHLSKDVLKRQYSQEEITRLKPE